MSLFCLRLCRAKLPVPSVSAEGLQPKATFAQCWKVGEVSGLSGVLSSSHGMTST